MSSDRTDVLARIRRALTDVPADETPDGVPVPRDYRRTGAHTDVVGLFIERVADYRADVHRIRPNDLPRAVAEALHARGARRVVVPAEIPDAWRPDSVETVADDATTTTADLDHVDGALTGCALGIAETGTIVLDGGQRSGRRAISLVPDYHLCVVESTQIVGTVPEAVAALDPRRPTTFVSGPSATSDIELDRVEGVHGPRTLVVLVVDQGMRKPRASSSSRESLTTGPRTRRGGRSGNR